MAKKTDMAEIQEALEATNWNKAEAARRLKIPTTTLKDRIRKYELEVCATTASGAIDPTEDQILRLEHTKTELKKERIKLQSEKLEHNKILREMSRSELIEEKILERIGKRPSFSIPNISLKKQAVKRDYLLPIADVHYSAEFKVTGWENEILNEYSPEIAQKRLWSILEQFVSYNDADKINHVSLVNIGDSLDGILRMSQLQWIRLGNVDSAIEFAEFMSTWVNQLSKYARVDYYSTQGNHTELRIINSKRGDFPHENMEKIVSHIISCNLKANKNVKIHTCKNHVYFNTQGTKVLAVHGHEEGKLDRSLEEYPKMYGHDVDLMLTAHLHHRHVKTIGMNGTKDIEYYQVPSIVGIDDFSMRIKKTSNAGADLMVITEEGRKTTHKLIAK